MFACFFIKRNMNIQYFLFFGLVFIELVIDFCRGSLDCPNAPVTPYQIISPPVSNPVIAPVQTTCCSNSQTNFCQTNSPCPSNQVPQCNSIPSFSASTTQCSGSTYSCNQQQCCTASPTQSCNSCYQQQCCQTKPIQPCYQNCQTNSCCCPSNPVPQCSSTSSVSVSTTQCCGSTNSCNQQQCCTASPTQSCNSCYQQQCCQARPIQPCYQNCQTNSCCCPSNQVPQCSSTSSVSVSTTQCCGSINSCNQQQCCTASPTQPPTRPIQTTTPEPDTIINCPPGTKLIGNTCHLLYCPRGHEMVNGRCIVIECPTGTVWNGKRCSIPEPVQHNVTFYNTIITQFNQTKQDIIINNTNNIVVNASLSLQNECNNVVEDCDNTFTPTEPQQTTPDVKCCEVMTPRICKNYNNRWRCYSRRSNRCGEFCIAPIIYLKPPRVYARPPYVVMPPIQQDCQLAGNCNPITGGYDCSGCAINDMERCSHYCYRYSCPSNRCNFYDQEMYCDHNGGSFGCKEEDGCFDNWCL